MTKKTKNGKQKKALIIDGNNMMCRAYFGNKQKLTSPTGELTNGTYTFFQMLNNALKLQDFDYLLVCWDIQSTDTWRFKLIEDIQNSTSDIKLQGLDIETYKNRPVTPHRAAIHAQKKRVIQLLAAYGIRQRTSLLSKGDEADDLMGSAAKLMAKEGVRVYIYTSDKDILQVVDNNISVLNPDKGEITYVGVKAVFGVPANQVADYLALAGDAVDSIAGVPGCGPATAKAWLSEWGSLENIFKNKKKIKGRGSSSLKNGNHLPWEILQKMTTINYDAYHDFHLPDFDLHAVVDRFHKNQRSKYVLNIKKELGMTAVLFNKVKL